MKTIWQDRYGGEDTLTLRDTPAPEPGKDEVLVRVRAASIDLGTRHLMTGLPLAVRLGTGLRAPRKHVPGRALAGVVEAVGEGVTGFAPGDEVYGTAAGALAELAVVPVARLARKPASLDFAQAAAVPVSAPTALQGLRDIGRIKAGQSVLVIGASGGVGTYAVQLARALGAGRVDAVCSGAKADLVRSLGADDVIDYTRTEPGADGRRWDLVLDIAGNRPVATLRRLLTPRGTLVFVGGESGGRWTGGMHRQLGATALSPFVHHRLAMYVARENGRDLETLGELADAGQLRSVVDGPYPFEETARAIARLDAGQARGKIVVTVSGD
ncbi:NAD(P)-dependent alcohol dehydrogenase [Nocardioides ungokensis]|uniref:NAD(P)-dependent alcohol dehydrogenase n=1 Tax=Nocardioides ungokensis TaxID=1643322 RepID=UPI0015DEB4A9|nr:NAD(P)-dependent alcohol dehydrogenase [Nocardioides ungokensis]